MVATDSARLDPQARAVLERAAASGNPPLYELSAAEARRVYRETRATLAPVPPRVAEVRELSIPGPAGALRARLYRPDSAGGLLPAMAYFHGGGFIYGDIDTHDAVCRGICASTPCVVISVDYRLAPEHKFPAAVEDGFAATQWIARNAASFGVDAGQVVIAGDSAGGGLSLATWMAAKAAGLPPPAALYLISPWANVGQTGAAYAAKAKTDPVLTKEALDRFAGAYLAGKTDAKTPLASPLDGDFAAAPPMLIQVGSKELLLSDSLGVAEAASLAGGDVTLRVWPEMVHIWPFFAANLAAGRAAIDEAAAWIREKIA